MTSHQPAPSPPGPRPTRRAGLPAGSPTDLPDDLTADLLAGSPNLRGPATDRRIARLAELDLERVDPEFDAFAKKLAEAARDEIGMTDSPIGIVNFLTGTRQFFAGVYVPPAVLPDSAVGASRAQVGREMPLDYGGCPYVVEWEKAVVLGDVCAYPRFWGNPAFDEVDIRSYMGAPVTDSTGTILGTVCVIDHQQRPWGRNGLQLIKTYAADLSERIRAREQRLGL
jgi:GAF domain-containing protein